MQMRALWQVGWANLRVVAICMLASAAMVALWHGVGLKSLAVGLVVVIGVGSVVFEAARIGTQSGLGWIAGALTPMLLNVLITVRCLQLVTSIPLTRLAGFCGVWGGVVVGLSAVGAISAGIAVRRQTRRVT